MGSAALSRADRLAKSGSAAVSSHGYTKVPSFGRIGRSIAAGPCRSHGAERPSPSVPTLRLPSSVSARPSERRCTVLEPIGPIRYGRPASRWLRCSRHPIRRPAARRPAVPRPLASSTHPPQPADARMPAASVARRRRHRPNGAPARVAANAGARDPRLRRPRVARRTVSARRTLVARGRGRAWTRRMSGRRAARRDTARSTEWARGTRLPSPKWPDPPACGIATMLGARLMVPARRGSHRRDVDLGLVAQRQPHQSGRADRGDGEQHGDAEWLAPSTAEQREARADGARGRQHAWPRRSGRCQRTARLSLGARGVWSGGRTLHAAPCETAAPGTEPGSASPRAPRRGSRRASRGPPRPPARSGRAATSAAARRPSRRRSQPPRRRPRSAPARRPSATAAPALPVPRRPTQRVPRAPVLW